MYYAIGDIHGRLDELRKLYDMILADIRTNGEEDNTIVFLGDYVDRGPDSFGVLDFLFNRQNTDKLTHVFIKGNHEDLFIASTTVDWTAPKPIIDQNAVMCWLSNGGMACVTEMGFDQYTDFLYDGGWQKYNQWLCENTIMLYDTEHYVFVHAGVDIRKPPEEQIEAICLWARFNQLNWYQSYPKMVIHGHTPNKHPKHDNNRINVDTSWYNSAGKALILTAVCLPNERDDSKIRFLATAKPEDSHSSFA